MHRRALLAAMAASSMMWACRGVPRQASPRERAIAKGVDWLLAQQGDDGRWRSATYGMWRGGQSLTPFVAGALLTTDRDDARAAAERAADALLALVRRFGAVGFEEGLVRDYPVYASGLTLSVCGALGWSGRAEVQTLAAWLRTQQRTTADGWAEHAAHGGFCMGAPNRVLPPHAGHVDLSMTRRAIDGLVAVGQLDATARDEARAFVRRCRTDEGTFVYSPVEPGLNKGALVDGDPRGYGSATTDGVLAMHRLAPDEPEEAAIQALEGWFRVDENPALGPNSQVFASAMRGYWRAGVAAAFAATQRGPVGWKAALNQVMVGEQREDGAWVNPSAVQKEDDPLVATALALRALAHTDEG